MRFTSSMLAALLTVAAAAPALAGNGGEGHHGILEVVEPFVLLVLGLGLLGANYLRRKR